MTATTSIAPAGDTPRELVEHALLQSRLDHLLDGWAGNATVDARLLDRGLHFTRPTGRVRLDLHDVDLHDVDLHDVDLHDVDLHDVDLHDVDLHDVALHGRQWSQRAPAPRDGHRVARGSQIWRHDPIGVELLELADIVKINLASLPSELLEPTIRTLRAHAPGGMLLAENVSKLLHVRTRMAPGLDQFQGYFFAKPELLGHATRSLGSHATLDADTDTARSVDTNPTGSTGIGRAGRTDDRAARSLDDRAALTLLMEVLQPDVSLQRIEQLVAADRMLTYRLLTLVNSGRIEFSSKVESVYHALVLLGIDRVRQLATLVTMLLHSRGTEDLVMLAATRAGMARALVNVPELEQSAHTAGLLSVLDAIFHAPMDELVADLPVAPVVVEALSAGTGPLGELLFAIRAYERVDLHALEALRPNELVRFIDAYRAAAADARHLRAHLAGIA